MNRTDSTIMNTEMHTISGAILLQTTIRYVAYFVIAWLALSSIDGWVMTYLTQPR